MKPRSTIRIAPTGGCSIASSTRWSRFAELGRLSALRTLPLAKGAVCVVSPKGRKDLRDADERAAARDLGLADTREVAFSQSRSAWKLVIPPANRPAGYCAEWPFPSLATMRWQRVLARCNPRVVGGPALHVGPLFVAGKRGGRGCPSPYPQSVGSGRALPDASDRDGRLSARERAC